MPFGQAGKIIYGESVIKGEKMNLGRKWVVVGLLILVGLLFSCTRRDRSLTKIKELKENVGAYVDKECKVWGMVTFVLDVPILNYDVFKIHDGSGEMWIFTTEGAPPERVKVKVWGTFKKLIGIPLPIKVEIVHYINLREMEFM